MMGVMGEIFPKLQPPTDVPDSVAPVKSVLSGFADALEINCIVNVPIFT